MTSKVLYENAVTQSLDAGKALAAFLGIKEELPEIIPLDGVKLVLSNKKDCFYVVTPKACSCPAATYRAGPCKHQRTCFPQPKTNQEGTMPNMRSGNFVLPEAEPLSDFDRVT